MGSGEEGFSHLFPSWLPASPNDKCVILFMILALHPCLRRMEEVEDKRRAGPATSLFLTLSIL